MVNQQEVTVITAIMGAQNLGQAMRDSLPLLRSAKANFTQQTLIKNGDIVGSYTSPWGQTTQAVASSDVRLLIWKDAVPKISVQLDPIKPPLSAGRPVGTIVVNKPGDKTVEVPVITAEGIHAPDLNWRLQHAFEW
jgi:D-alanyl-D-alanine carboxypeptidase (penicillin-binding protein 5/6)